MWALPEASIPRHAIEAHGRFRGAAHHAVFYISRDYPGMFDFFLKVLLLILFIDGENAKA